MISVVIPAYNEEAHVKATIQKLWEHDEQNLIGEIIVCDGASDDNTASVAQSEGVKVVTSPKGRAKQMNAGAMAAQGEILYFFHADSLPPQKFTTHIIEAYNKGYMSGCFRLAFDYDHWFLKANAWFTRFDVNAVRFGDQSLFVTKEIFQKAGGFRENLLMMEDQEIIHRIKQFGRFKVMNEAVITSARKYVDNGVYRMQGIFYRIWAMYYLGYSQEQMLMVHRRVIKNHKL
jgi:rSAM/selenodomain-associated transferase 2